MLIELSENEGAIVYKLVEQDNEHVDLILDNHEGGEQ
jgi:hypothetical protein